MSKRILGLIAVVALTLCSSVHAAAFCSDGLAAQPDLSVADVSLNGVNADNCYGIVLGTNDASNIGFTGFTALATASDGGTGKGSIDGIDFTLGAAVTDHNPDMGTWSLSWSGGTAPITLDLIAVVQTKVSFASYLFALTLDTPGSASGDWVINYMVSETFPLFDSFAIYAANISGETIPPPTGVDEPGVLALLGFAGIMLAFARRRRQPV